MGSTVMALTAACVALVAASARAQPELAGQAVFARSVVATHGVRANAITSFGVACRNGFTAVSAGVTAPAPGTTVLAIAPVGLSGYRFRIDNPAGNGNRRITVAVACRKVGAGAASFVLRLKPLKQKTIVVPPHRSASATLSCLRGTTSANGGFALGSTALSVRRDTATLRSASYTLANAGARAHRAVVYGACLTLFRTADSPFQQLHVRVTTDRVRLRPGAETFARSCPKNWFSLDAGYALRAPTTELNGSAPTTTGARWKLTNPTDGAVFADVQVACGRLGP